MKCPRCGSEVGIGATQCPRCALTLGKAVAAGVLTPPPAGPPPHEDDVTTIGVSLEDLTIVPPTSDVTTLAQPPAKGGDPDATVLMPGRLQDIIEGMTLAPATRPPARTQTRR